MGFSFACIQQGSCYTEKSLQRQVLFGVCQQGEQEPCQEGSSCSSHSNLLMSKVSNLVLLSMCSSCGKKVVFTVCHLVKEEKKKKWKGRGSDETSYSCVWSRQVLSWAFSSTDSFSVNKATPYPWFWKERVKDEQRTKAYGKEERLGQKRKMNKS